MHLWLVGCEVGEDTLWTCSVQGGACAGSACAGLPSDSVAAGVGVAHSAGTCNAHQAGGIGVPVLHCVPVGYVMPNPTLAGALYMCVRKNL